MVRDNKWLNLILVIIASKQKICKTCSQDITVCRFLDWIRNRILIDYTKLCNILYCPNLAKHTNSKNFKFHFFAVSNLFLWYPSCVKVILLKSCWKLVFSCWQNTLIAIVPGNNPTRHTNYINDVLADVQCSILQVPNKKKNTLSELLGHNIWWL